jgi:hypothetical protein
VLISSHRKLLSSKATVVKINKTDRNDARRVGQSDAAVCRYSGTMPRRSARCSARHSN